MDERDTLLSSIRTLSERKETLLREISDIDHELATQNSNYARILNEETPIYRLPNELLSDILLSCQRTSLPLPRDVFRGPVTLFHVTAARVSQRWRAVVLSTPLLWSTINLFISMKTAQRMLGQLRAHLLHSGACFIDVWILFEAGHPSGLFFETLKGHAERWRMLTVEASEVSEVFEAELYRLLVDVRAPKLEHLTLSFGDEHDCFDHHRTRYASVLPTILASGADDAPKLTFVRLAGHALGTLHPPLSRVTTLHLDGWTHRYITPDQLRTVLTFTPVLANLSLAQLVMHITRDPTTNPPPRLVLPFLRQLRICGSCSPVARFFEILEFPGLEALTLRNIESPHCGPLPSVRALRLDICGLDEADMQAIVRMMPGVERFAVDQNLPYIWQVLLPDEVERDDEEAGVVGKPRPWPRLTSLELRGLEPRDVGFFCHFVNSVHRRRDAHTLAPPAHADALGILVDGDTSGIPLESGLTTLYLDRRSRTVLRTKHKLDWLAERVAVVHHDALETWPVGLGYVDDHDLECC